VIGEVTRAVAFAEAAAAAVTGPQPGSRFGGYDIVRLLGSGGMGMVFEAEQVETGRRVALKVLNHALDLPEARKRFLREGRLAASVSHPNLVYIFGTEEIEGNLVIAMELVTGGTLKERINRDGPLPVKEAVDVCLQLIAGLEVAAAAGVLHRDIKPANCFVDSDGVVKVGDFGLSISTLARAETQLTTSGAFLGTPTFSSPEQLRGDALDVRSDIYAVGVTLYYLLTGKTPFEGDNFVKLLTTVLEKAPESPTRFRPEIPRGLAKAVLRCLAKKPGQRFKSYAELRAALQPFASSAPRPASLNLRGGAGILDGLIAGGAIFGLFSLAHSGPWLLRPWGVSPLVGLGFQYLMWIAYYSIFEGVWAATPGKAACKLRLVREDGGKATLVDALIRALWFLMTPAIPFFLVQVLLCFQIGRGHENVMLIAALAGYLIQGLLFVSVRKRNGYAGLHDLWSRTRVITLARPEGQRVWIQPAGEAIPEGEFPFRIGPYNSVNSLDQAADFQLLAGYDPELLRKVWIQKLPAGTPPVFPDRQKLSRATRVRWIGGRRSTEENWDAYEAVSGGPLFRSQARPASWSQVRYWLLDLAQEIEAGSRTQTMVPVLKPDRVWIGADGRVKLLDVLPTPTLPMEETEAPLATGAAPATGSVPPVFVDTQTGQLFLKQVALAALEGPAGQRDSESLRPPAVPLPLHARQFLEKLPRFANWDALIQELKELVSRPAAVSRSTRLKGLVFLGIPWIFLAAMWPVMALRGILGAQAVTSSFGLVVVIFGIFVVVPSFICAALFRGGYVAYRSGVTFVKRDGSPASRARLLWRNLLTWLPFLLVIPVEATANYKVLVTTAAALLVVVSAFGIFRCLKVPERSFADCLAGTWMVPR
jgi:uncharacterized RDD family membrane protein YckC